MSKTREEEGGEGGGVGKAKKKFHFFFLHFFIFTSFKLVEENKKWPSKNFVQLKRHCSDSLLDPLASKWVGWGK